MGSIFKSVAAICLAGMVLLACGQETMAAEKKVGVLWFGKSGMADRVAAGFEKIMKAKAPNIAIEVKPALEEGEAAATFAAWQKEKDAIVFLRSNGAKFVAKNTPAVPTFLGACSNPEELGVMKDMGKPDGNITGVTYFLPHEISLNMFRKMIPDIKSVGLLVMKGHPSSAVDQKGTQEECKKAGIAYHEAICGTTDEVAAATKDLAPKVDIFILGNQALLIDNSNIVAANCSGKPVMSYAQKPIQEKNALAGLVPDDKKLGGMLADSVIDVLVNGKKVSEVPVKTDPQPKLWLCIPKMKEWGVKVPLAQMKAAETVK